MDKEILLNHIVDFLKEKVNPKLIILFGSFASGKQRSDSDVDIAFISDKPVDKYELFLMRGELEGIACRDVDLIDLKTIETVFSAEIVSSGEVIYCADENFKTNFNIKTLSMYANFNEERKEIIEGIRKRGNVYGE